MPDRPEDDTSNSKAADYGPPDEPMTYDETGDEAGRGRMVLLLAVVFVGAAIALLFVVFQQGVRTGGRNAPPVIVADTGPEKVKPEDPGGLEVPNQDKTVYDRVSGEDAERVEKLLPEPEEPVDISGLRTSEAAETAGDESGMEETSASAPDEALKELPVQEPEAAASEVVNEVQNIGELIESLPDTEAEPIGNSVAEVDEGAVNRASGTIPAATSGAFVVQVASFKGADLATGGWEALNRKNGDLLANLRPDIQLADLGERGVYYRLRIGPFATKAEAQALCTALKARRQDCLVRPT